MTMSEEQKKALSERMKEKWAAKKAQAPEFKEGEVTETVSRQDYNELLRQVEELKGMFAQKAPQVAPHMTNTGKLIGRVDKFIVDPANYANPCARLAQEPRLQRFAFTINYDLDFKVSSTQYQNLEGVNMREPKFTLELYKVVMDDETGEPTDQRYVLGRWIGHEDPEAAIVIARENGIEIDETDERKFLDEMRYIRMRDWLLEIFYPRAAQPARGRKEVVVGGKLVELFTVNSETSQSPFRDINANTKKL